MRPPFYRACPKHKEELEDRTKSSKGHEILYCRRGRHRCRTWLVLDGEGETLAVGHINEVPKILSPDLIGVAPNPPERFCQRGHYEWYLSSDGRYRCRICKRDRLLLKQQTREEPPKRAPSKELTPRERKKLALDILRAVEERKALNKRLRKEQRCLILKTR